MAIVERPLLWKASGTFVLFCLLSSSVYILNDLVDLNRDKIHPLKKNRPIASGKLHKSVAKFFAVVLPVLVICLAYLIAPAVALVCGIYYVLFALYSFRLKEIVILDVLIIAIGFVLRVFAGALAVGVAVSHWLMICAMFIALFLGFCKRRNEIVLLDKDSHHHRKNLSDYSIYFLDQMVSVTTASIIISYTLYTTSQETISRIGTDQLIYTVPFVLYGIFRYLFLVYKKNQGGSPTDIVVGDKPFIVNLGLWVLAVAIILY